MANRFEQSGTLNTDYGIVQDIENRKDNLEKLSWERKVKTSVSLKKTNLDKLDELVNKLHVKSRSELLDTLIEQGYEKFTN
ncbi:ribbon-helix-helix protein, CopG family [Weissella confusa]|uniref:Ribbon-helix-helix protein, CopG family n=2 Tax=Lactobacillaceae TaxID=33958 RepID=A0AA40YT15_WEICO|nr:ribbon-helix-helix protein, CopG family [Weissella confusa]MBJ7639910.1 ribbon-helix-helix protein, CopG family [Weissella confusa]